jgi:ParB family transcriptional regulator, chromosome partitioning protein
MNMSMAKKKGLGRGLESLLSTVAPTKLDFQPGETLRELPLDHIQPGRYQPRRTFEEGALNELADSIRAQGVVQPIVVRSIGANQYEIVAGERRWRAAKLAELKNIPAVIRTLDERGAMAVALVENIQRADLNPLEEADAMQRLIQECGLTHEECAQAVGRKRATISNLLRLRELEDEVQQHVREQKLSFGHAKVLLGVTTGPRRVSIARLVVDKGLSVRATEALVQAENAPKAPPGRELPRPFGKLEAELSARLGTSVKIDNSRGDSGKLTIVFKDMGELERVIGLIR